MKDAIVVAKRCLGLELLAQRLAIETDEASSVSEREAARAAWAGRIADFAADLSPGEAALMEKSVGTLSDEDLDVLDGGAAAAPVLLWALERLEVRPTFETSIAEVLEDAGLLGDGSVAGAKTAVAEANLRDEGALGEGEAAYRARRGKAKETDEPEKIYAEVAAHYLTWVLEADAEWADA